MRKIILVLSLSSMCLILSACSKKDTQQHTSLKKQLTTAKSDSIQQSKNKNQKILARPPVIYQNAGGRSPFQETGSRTSKASAGRGLHDAPIGTLKFKGIIKNRQASWAVIETPDGGIYRLGVDQKLGSENGKIVTISKDKVKIAIHSGKKGTFLTIRRT